MKVKNTLTPQYAYDYEDLDRDLQIECAGCHKQYKANEGEAGNIYRIGNVIRMTPEFDIIEYRPVIRDFCPTCVNLIVKRGQFLTVKALEIY